jgi:secondary thiamine-phosphate synthase enzyme
LQTLWYQRRIQLRARSRGFHLITREVRSALPEVDDIAIGTVHLFMQHTSASLALNENASPDVLRDFERHFAASVPEDASYWEHTLEGPDDMPAHIKAAILGASLVIPVNDGDLALGTWQGIYLCEHRNRGGGRNIVATITGEGR